MNKPSRSRLVPRILTNSVRSLFKRYVAPLSLLLLAMPLMGARVIGCGDIGRVLGPDDAPTMNTIKLGLILNRSGFISTQHGAQLALIEVNAQGGLLGTPIELMIRDSAGDPDRAEQLAEQLITQDNAVAILGPNSLEEAVRVGAVVQQHRVPMMVTTVTDAHVTDAGEFVFLTTFTDAYQAEVMATFARETLNAGGAAILTEIDNAHSEELSELFATHFRAFGGTVVAQETYHAGDTDFTEHLTRIAQHAPDVIFMPDGAPEVPLAVQQARQIPQPNANAISAAFLGSSRWDTPEVYDIEVHPWMEDHFYSGIFAAEFPEQIQEPPNTVFTESEAYFISAYTAMYGIQPDGPAALGYDAVRLVVTAMRRAGEAEGEAIRDQIAATHGYKGATLIQEYDENRHPTKNAIVLRIGDEPHFHQRFDPPDDD